MPQGSCAKLRACNHFLEEYNTVVLTTGTALGQGVGLIGVNEGSIASTVDEPGGILAITTDTGDNDNHFLISGPFKPADGGMVMECRFKMPADVLTTTLCVSAGFSETMSRTTPVMPAEFDTATLTINGTGGMACVVFDTDGTVIDFRAVVADAGALLAGIDTNGTRLNMTITADKWYIVRVEVGPDGKARIYMGDADDSKSMKLVEQATAALPTTEVYTAFLGIENRSGAARILEVDYFMAESWVDWDKD